MGFLSRLLEKRAHPSSNMDWSSWFGRGVQTHAGVDVTVDSALTYAAYYACIHVISETIATLPLIVYERLERGKKRAVNLPLYQMLHDDPNPEMTSVEYQETKLGHVLSWGNHYSEIEYNGAGKPIALWPLRPDKMEVKRIDGKLVYPYTLPNGEIIVLPAWRVHHLRGLGNDGIVGYSPTRMAMQAIGAGLGTEEYGARFFGNGARPGAVLKTPVKLSDAAYNRLKNSMNEDHGGLSNSHRMKILEEGLDVQTIGVPPEEAQFLETQKFQAIQIARFFRMPLHKIQSLENATFSNIEHQSIEFVVDCILPWAVRNEKRLAKDLLNKQERKQFIIKHLLDGLLRGDTASRYAAYTTGINAGLLTRNEARELEDLNPLDGLDEPLMPLNMVAVGSQPVATSRSTRNWSDQLSIETREARADKATDDRRALMNRNVRLFEEAAARVVKREAADIRKAAKAKLGKRDAAGFESWLESFYKQLREWFPDYFRNIMLTYAESIMASVADELDGEPVELDDDLRKWVEGYLSNYTEVYAVGGEKQLRALLAESQGDEDAEKRINERMDGWESTKAGKEGFAQAFEAGNALAVYGYAAGEIGELVWRGGDCPLCKKFNGRRIPIRNSFAKAGDEITAEGVDPFPVVRTIKHGPLHGGCDCLVMSS